MRIVVVRDEPYFWIARILCRNRRKVRIETMRYKLGLRMTSDEIDRVLRFYAERKMIVVTSKHVKLPHDIDIVFTYFDKVYLFRATNRDDINPEKQ